MATYNAIKNKGAEFLEAQDDNTKAAFAAMKVLHNRKGFDWWFDELETPIKNEIFDDIRKALKAYNVKLTGGLTAESEKTNERPN